jgi:hypothetical protein
VIGHQLLELLAGVLAAAIRVMQQRIGLASPPDCHHQGPVEPLTPSELKKPFPNYRRF